MSLFIKKISSVLVRAFLLVVAVVFADAGLQANPLTVSGSVWSGEYNTGLEKRLFQDDLIDGAPDGIPRFNLKWRGASDSVYPVSVTYEFSAYDLDLIASGAYLHRNMGYRFFALHSNARILSHGEFLGGYAADWLLDVRLKTDLLGELLERDLPVSLGPGVRYHTRNFNLKDVTYGDTTMYVTTDGAFRSHASSLYLRLSAAHPLQRYSKWLKSVSVVTDIYLPLTTLSTGKFRSNFTKAGRYFQRIYYESNQMDAGYTVQALDGSVGVRYEPVQWLDLEIGFRREVSYTEIHSYQNLPVRYANGGMGVDFSPHLEPEILWQEFFLEKFVYPVERRAAKQGAYFKAGYQLDLDLF